MKTWATTRELAELEKITPVAIIKRIETGKYTQVKKVRGHGGGIYGDCWLINISDAGISDEIKYKFYLKHFFHEAIRIIGDTLVNEIKKIEAEILKTPL